MKSRLSAIVAICVAGATAASCGTSGPAVSTHGATSSTTATSSQPSQNVSADKALADAEGLRLADFPAGWTSGPNPQDNSQTPAIDAQLASCLHRPVSLFNNKSPAEAVSPNFSDSNGNQASSDITYEASASHVQDEFSVFQEPQFTSCLQTALNAYLAYELQHPSNPNDTIPPGMTLGRSNVAQMSFPSLGDRSIAFRLTLPFSVSGTNLDGYFDIVAVQQGRAAISTLFFGIGSPFDGQMEQQLTTLTVHRVATAATTA